MNGLFSSGIFGTSFGNNHLCLHTVCFTTFYTGSGILEKMRITPAGDGRFELTVALNKCAQTKKISFKVVNILKFSDPCFIDKLQCIVCS